MARQTTEYNPWLHWFALFAGFSTIFLIVAGATVTSTVSGDSVPDWPLSYGTLNPPMIGGIFWEHSHRLIAGFTGIVIGLLAIALWMKEPRKYVKWFGMTALIAVVIQAILGGLRVLIVSTEGVQDAAVQMTGSGNIEATRIAITVTHASLAQTILCMVFSVALFTSKWWLNGSEASQSGLPKKARVVSIGLVAIVFLQLVIGAIVRHTGSGLIIPDFPLSFGQILPPFGDLPNNPNAPFPLTDQEFFLKVLIHFAHRMTALVILGWVIYLFAAFRKSERIGKLASIIFGLTLIQVFLGAMNIWTAKSIYSTIPHVAIGALILACSVMLMWWAIRLKDGAGDDTPIGEPSELKPEPANSI